MRATARRSRDGFTLVELAIAVGLLVPVTLVVTTLGVQAAREAAGAAVIAEAGLSQEMAVIVLEAELMTVAPGDGLLGISPSAIQYRARRAAGRWCVLDSLGVIVPTGPGGWAASRAPVPGRDSVVLMVVDSSRAAGWRPARVGLIAPPVAVTCPNGLAGVRLPLAVLPISTLAGDLVQTEEVVELAAYSSAGLRWMGLRHLALGTPIEPLAGPFGATGVVFTGYDAGGLPTAIAGDVQMLHVDIGSSSPRVGARRVLIRLRG